MHAPETPHPESPEQQPETRILHEKILHPQTHEELDEDIYYGADGRVDKVIIRNAEGVIVNFTNVRDLSEVDWNAAVRKELMSIDKPETNQGVGPLHL